MSSSTSPPAIGPTPEPAPASAPQSAPPHKTQVRIPYHLSRCPVTSQSDLYSILKAKRCKELWVLVKGNGYAENGVSDLNDKEPVLPRVLHIEDWDNFGDMDKYRIYEADYTCRLMSKYFSKQTLYGGDIFEERAMIDGEVIQSSRWPCTRSYADPVNSFHEIHDNSMNSVPETNSAIANGKPSMEKTG